MKKIYLFAVAALMTAACTEREEAENTLTTEQETVTQGELEGCVTGKWVDPVMYGQTQTVRLYAINDDGTCQLYDVTEPDGTENPESDMQACQQQGTWTASTELSDGDMAADIRKEGMQPIGTLTLKTTPVVPEDHPYYELYCQQKKDGMDFGMETQLSVVRMKDSGSVAFLSESEFYYLKMARESGQGQNIAALLATMRRTDADGTPIETLTRAMTSSQINKAIKSITQGKALSSLVNPINSGQRVDMSDWMKTFYSGLNPRICDMSIPGTHDTFTSYMSGWNPMALWAQTQTQSLEEQWASGVRYFDARVRVDGGKLALYHTFSLDITFRQALRKLKNLLNKHSQEMAIVVVNFDDGSTNYKMVYDELKAEVGSCLITNPTPDLRLNKCRGKILVLNRYNSNAGGSYSVGPSVRGSWADNTKGKEGNMVFASGKQAKLYLQDFYHYPVRMLNNQRKDKKNAITNGFNFAAKNAGTGSCVWVLNHQSGYSYTIGGAAEYATMDYADNSKNMNPVVESCIRQNLGKKTGIVIMDFAGSKSFALKSLGGLTSRMVAMNNYYLVKNHSISLDVGDKK